MKKWYIMLSLCCFSLALHAQQAGDQETGATPADSVVIMVKSLQQLKKLLSNVLLLQ